MQIKNNNSFISLKQNLRKEVSLLVENPFILDCNAGKSISWKNLNHKRVKLDIKDYGNENFLMDNCKFLQSANLRKFTIIDIDVYGCPYKQIKILFDKRYKGYVIFTFIQSVMGNISHKLIESVGFKQDVINECPTIFGKFGFCIFKDWLSKNGVDIIVYANPKNTRKYYGYFILK